MSKLSLLGSSQFLRPATFFGLVHEPIPLWAGQNMPGDSLDFIHGRLGSGEPLSSCDKVVDGGSSPDRHIYHNSVVHGFWRGVWPADGEHRQCDPKYQEYDSTPRDGDTDLVSGVEGARCEFLPPPYNACEDGNAPGKVVARHGQGEQSGRGGWGDQAKKTQYDGNEDGPPNCTKWDVAEGFRLYGKSIPAVALYFFSGQ